MHKCGYKDAVDFKHFNKLHYIVMYHSHNIILYILYYICTHYITYCYILRQLYIVWLYIINYYITDYFYRLLLLNYLSIANYLKLIFYFYNYI